MKKKGKAIEFIKTLESNDFEVEDYNKINKLTELVSRGDDGPANLLNILIKLKESVENFDIAELSKSFINDIKLDFDNLSHIIKRNTKGKDGYEELKILINQLKSKLDLISLEQLEPELSSSSNQKFLELTNNPNLTPAQKWRKYKEMYNEEHPNKNEIKFYLTENYIDEIIESLNNLYKEIFFFDIDISSRKTLIESFATSINTLLFYKKELSRHQIEETRYENLKIEFGITKNYGKEFSEQVNKKNNNSETIYHGKKVLSSNEDLKNAYDTLAIKYLSYGNLMTSADYINFSIRSVYAALFLLEELKDLKESKEVSEFVPELLNKANEEIALSNLPQEEKDRLYNTYENTFKNSNNKKGRFK